jgi:hypothetical protein
MVAHTRFNVTLHVHFPSCKLGLVLDDKFMVEVERCMYTKQVCLIQDSCDYSLLLCYISVTYILLCTTGWYCYCNVPLNDPAIAGLHWMILLLPCTNELYYYYHVPINYTTTAMYQWMIILLPCTNEWNYYCLVPINDTTTAMYQ